MHGVRSLLAVTIWLMLATSLLAQEPRTTRAFQRYDRNKDGKLTKDEFQGPLFERIDTNGDGVITIAEDQAFARRARGLAAENTTESDQVKSELDIPYAATKNPRQTLDMFLPAKPANSGPLPVVVFVHGGGWQNGDKRRGRTLMPFVESGKYAGVSIGYRLSDEATWPAQIHDCKAAIRWIKANAKKYNLDPKRIGATGTSAGGHLVAMLGTTGDLTSLEGSLGEHSDLSSRVACVVDQYGPTDLLTMGGRHNDPESPESKLVGGPLQDRKDVARNASPTTHVSSDDAPFLLIHGKDDPVVPFNQSELLAAALKKADVEAVLVPVTGGGHGGFNSPEVLERMMAFFDKHLLDEKVAISAKPIAQGPARRRPSR